MPYLLIMVFFAFLFPSYGEFFDIEKWQKNLLQNIQKYELKNGLRIILMKNGTSPSLALYLKIGVGSADEPFDQAGTAHFLEHLLFKGTKTLGTLDYAREELYLEQIFQEGERFDFIQRQLLNPLLPQTEKANLLQEKEKAEKRLALWQKLASPYVVSEEDSQIYTLAGQVGYNAYTTTDVTNYQIKLPKNRLELWAAMESERFLEPVFREFYPERQVVLEERRLRYDTRPASLLYELYLETAFGISPYGKPVIGFAENIPRLSYQNTKKFFLEHYTPSQMVIAVVGDVDFDKTYSILEKYFSRLKKRPSPPFVPITQNPKKGMRKAYLKVDSTPQFIMGYPRPSLFHQDALALDVLARILGEGQSSRLRKRLILEDKIASSVNVYSSVPGEKLDTSFAIFCSVFRFDQYEKAEKAIEEELEKIARESISQEELEKVKNNYLSDLMQTLETNAGLADNLTYYELMFGDYKVFFQSLENLQKISPKDLSQTAKKYFVPENKTIVYIQPPKP